VAGENADGNSAKTQEVTEAGKRRLVEDEDVRFLARRNSSFCSLSQAVTELSVKSLD
jgi:hypothetical protein